MDDPASRQLQGAVAYLDGDLDLARREWELAFRGWRAAGHPRSAARVAADLAELHTTSLGRRAAGAGWVQRARRLLEPVGRCVEQGYVGLALVACEAPDVDRLLEHAEHALELALEFGDADLEVRALADGGYALVVQGRSAEGFGRLDEAMAALSAGEVAHPGVAGMSYCALLSACDRAGDLRRAEEWTRVIAETFLAPLEGRLQVLHHHCRIAYGSVLCTVGRWSEGEEAMLEVIGAPAAAVAHQADGAARLAGLRLLQGRFEEAAELLRGLPDRPSVAEPLGRLHLLTGEADLAAAVVRRGLEDVAGDRLRLGALLGLLVEVELVRGDRSAAGAAATRLAELVAATGEPSLSAEAELARARIDRDPDAYRRAAGHLGEDRPLVCGTIALELAELLSASGDAAAATVEAGLALATFDRLGATLLADRTNALLRSLGTRSRATGRPPAAAVAGLTAREAEVLGLLREGLTNAEIGSRLYISAKTAEHHVGHVLAKLGVRSRAEAAAVAAAASRRGAG